MTFDPTDGVSLTELIRLVRIRLGDFPQYMSQTETGDAVKTFFRLHEGVYEDNGVTVTLDGTADTNGTIDYDSSTMTYTSAPDGALIFTYSTVVWTDERITEAINSAIDEMFGPAHVPGMNDDLVYSGPELLAEISAGNDLGPEDRVTKVERWDDTYWVRVTDWEVFTDGTSKYIRFHSPLDDDTVIRIHYIVRPGNLTSGSNTLEGTAGLPTRFKEPVVLIACSSLVGDRVNKRVKDDRSHNTQNENPVKSYEIQNDAQYLRNQAEVIMRRLKMSKLTTRLIPN